MKREEKRFASGNIDISRARRYFIDRPFARRLGFPQA
jgi:hypothetical protein